MGIASPLAASAERGIMAADLPLLLTDDPELLDELIRLAAAAGVEVQVAADPGAAWPAWTTAPLVIAAAAVGVGLRRARLPRREGVVLVGSDPSDADVWALAQEVGADHVVFLPAAQSWLVERLGACQGGPAETAPLVAVLGGRGGGGASVLAVALALTSARRGGRTVLVDADALGGGLDLVLGAEGAAGLRWPDLAATSGRLAVEALSAGLPEVSGVSLLSWDRGDRVDVPVTAMVAVLGAARRDADLVVADLPRRLDESAVAVLRDSDIALLVLPAEVRACAAAARVLAAALPHCAEVQVVVRGPAPAGLSSRDVSAALGVPVAGVLRPEPGLAAALERGEPPGRRDRGPLAEFCADFLDRLSGSTSL